MPNCGLFAMFPKYISGTSIPCKTNFKGFSHLPSKAS